MSLFDSFRSKFNGSATRATAVAEAPPNAVPAPAAPPPTTLPNSRGPKTSFGLAPARAAAVTPAPVVAAVVSPAAPAIPKPTPKRVLLVDDDAAIVARYREDLSALQPQWEITCATSGAEALERANQHAFDAVVSDIHMPKMNGVTLFNEIIRKRPKILRYIRIAPEDRDLLKNCIGTAPQHLTTDVDAEGLEAALQRGFQLDAWMNDEALKRLIPQLTKLPSMPTLYTKITAELQSPKGSIENVARLIAQDPMMTAKMLQVVNSAFFALQRQITDPNDAVMFLGAERTKSLIMLAKIFSQFDNAKCAGFAAEQLWGHSMQVGELARRISLSQNCDPKTCEMAFTAGLLHDVGKLLLAANLPGSFSQVLTVGKQKKISATDAEREAYGTTHAEIGACLLGVWGLPLNILEAIAWHHAPMWGTQNRFSLLTAVHSANALLWETSAKTPDDGAAPPQLDTAYLASLGLAEELDAWREMLPTAEAA